MIDSESRYARIGQATMDTGDGTRVMYLRRRMIADPETIPAVRSVYAMESKTRLDLLSALALGDAFAFWRLCDANGAMNPFEVVDECGGRLRVPSGAAS
jgi:hypothetical protein